jgi:hypothetical protein
MGGMGALSLGNATIPLPVQGVPGRCLLIKNLFDPFAPDQEVRVGCVPCVAWHAWGQADRTPKQTRPPIYIYNIYIYITKAPNIYHLTPHHYTPTKRKRNTNLSTPHTPPQHTNKKQKQDGWDLDIKEDVEDECGRYGAVKHVLVDVKTPGGMVYVVFGEEPVGVCVCVWCA